MRRSLCPRCSPALQCSLALQKHTNLCTLKDHTYCTPFVALQHGMDRRNMHYQNHAEHFPLCSTGQDTHARHDALLVHRPSKHAALVAEYARFARVQRAFYARARAPSQPASVAGSGACARPAAAQTLGYEPKCAGNFQPSAGNSAHRQSLLDGCIPIVDILIGLHPAQGRLQPGGPGSCRQVPDCLQSSISAGTARLKPKCCQHTFSTPASAEALRHPSCRRPCRA